MVPRWSLAGVGDQGRLTVIYDERYTDARAFADYLRTHGAATLPTRGDATRLWYGGARPRDGGTIAGLTTWSDLVIARSRGRELGLRLVFEGRHDGGFDRAGYEDHAGQVAREPNGPARLFAEAVTRVAAGRDSIEASGRWGHLVTWLLMPRVSCPGGMVTSMHLSRVNTTIDPGST